MLPWWLRDCAVCRGRALALVAAALLGGCAGAPIRYEAAWQALHLVDLGQTVHIARTPSCYYEAMPVTRDLIGRHPSSGEAVLLMLAYSGLHWYLDERLEGPWRTGFRVATMAITVRNVVHNAGIGLRPFGAGCP